MKNILSLVLFLFIYSCSNDDTYFGCTDPLACNYESYATTDNGFCEYYWEWDWDQVCDCDGNVTDCAGECGGDAVVDECGVCDGPGYLYCSDGSSVCDLTDCP